MDRSCTCNQIRKVAYLPRIVRNIQGSAKLRLTKYVSTQRETELRTTILSASWHWLTLTTWDGARTERRAGTRSIWTENRASILSTEAEPASCKPAGFLLPSHSSQEAHRASNCTHGKLYAIARRLIQCDFKRFQDTLIRCTDSQTAYNANVSA